MKPKICFAGLLCLFFRVSAQQVTLSKNGLAVGDTIPNVTLTQLLNFPSTTASISSFKGKSLILDFWATWCTSCLHHFPELDSLQHQFGNKVQILLVNTMDTRDTRTKILSVYDRFAKRTPAGFSLPTVIDDTILNRLFPHFQIPHVVWIDQAGVVRSITSADELTPASMRKFIAQNATPITQKRDFDPHRPLYTDAALPLSSLQQYSILLKGKTDGIGQGGMRRINDTVRGLIAHNQSLYWIFRLILDNKIPGLNDNRLLVEVNDPAKLYYIPGGQTKLQWERDNDYSYELVVPATQIGHLYEYALADLNRYTDFNASIEQRAEDCWILTKVPGTVVPIDTGHRYRNDLTSTTDAHLSGSTLFNLCLFINQLGGGKLIVLDETNFTQNVNIDFGQPITSLASLQAALPRFGLTLREMKKTVPMMVIRDKSNFNLNLNSTQ